MVFSEHADVELAPHVQLAVEHLAHLEGKCEPFEAQGQRAPKELDVELTDSSSGCNVSSPFQTMKTLKDLVVENQSRCSLTRHQRTDLVQLRRLNADPLIFDLEHHLCRSRADPNGNGAFSTVLECVRDEIKDDVRVEIATASMRRSDAAQVVDLK